MRAKFICCLFSLLSVLFSHSQNHVAASMEWVSSGTISLTSSGSQPWTTYRSSTPGYFSATQGAAYTNASDAVHIDGYVKKYGDEAFVFPIGSGIDVRTLSISAPSSATDAYASAWIIGDPNAVADPTLPNSGLHPTAPANRGSGIISLATVGQWDWQAVNGSGAGLTVTVSIPDMTAFTASASNLRLVGWNGTQWINLSGSTGASGLTENSTLSGTMVSGITALNIGSTSSVLPLTLSYFSVKAENCAAVISFGTQNEAGILAFDIERSTDGSVFTNVSTLKPRGGSNIYQQTTAQRNGSNFYRLKILDASGKVTYSAVQMLATPCNDNQGMTVAPNPATAAVTSHLHLTSSYRGQAQVVLTSAGGQVVWKQAIRVDAISSNVSLPTGTLTPGTYYLQLLDAKGKTIQAAIKFVKL